MIAIYQDYRDGEPVTRTAEIYAVQPKEGVFAGPVVPLAPTTKSSLAIPGEVWRGFEDSFYGGHLQLITPGVGVIHSFINKLYMLGRGQIFYRYVRAEYKNGRLIDIKLMGRPRRSALDFFSKRQRVYIPYCKGRFLSYSTPIKEGVLGWSL